MYFPHVIAPPAVAGQKRYRLTDTFAVAGRGDGEVVDVGQPTSDRRLVYVSTARNASDLDFLTITIDATAYTFTRLTTTFSYGGTADAGFIAISDSVIPSGTSGTVSIEYTGGPGEDARVAIYAVYGVQSSTAIDTVSRSDTSDSVSTTGGKIIIAGANGGTWTNLVADTTVSPGSSPLYTASAITFTDPVTLDNSGRFGAVVLG